jgi:hypothetical protein
MLGSERVSLASAPPRSIFWFDRTKAAARLFPPTASKKSPPPPQGYPNTAGDYFHSTTNPDMGRSSRGKLFSQDSRARIFKLLRSPRIESEERQIRYDNPIPARFLAPMDCSKISALC